AQRTQAAHELASMRDYLDAVKLATEAGELAADRAFTREQLSFVSLLSEPHQLAGMRATFDMFRTSYVSFYVKHHDAYWRAFSRLRTALKDAEPGARALERLNTLRALGRPVGEAELAAYERLSGGPRACAARTLAAQLSEQPRCRDCGIALGEVVPDEEVEAVVRGLGEALARQQARLASEAVRRILARGGERIEQFLQIAQASDQAGLTQVLDDDDLLDFLRELLAEPAAPTPEALDLFEELARAHPLVSAQQVDAVVETLRELLTERLAAQQSTDSAPSSFRLASETAPQP
ncbi:MAG: hypothetical protein Q8S13_10460, partial [Dehalococcoidia bacterium]|nr:hypothetical protein [Dehalococcoidia bacterium]